MADKNGKTRGRPKKVPKVFKGKAKKLNFTEDTKPDENEEDRNDIDITPKEPLEQAENVVASVSPSVINRLRKRSLKLDGGYQSVNQLAHECSLCGEVYSDYYKLKQHERQEHLITIGRQCVHCMNARFYDPLYEEKKKKVIGNKKIVTKEDDKKIEALLVHKPNINPQRHQMVFSSTGQASHQCTVCFKLLPRCWDNSRHQSLEHTETDTHAKLGFQCHGCSQLFKTQITLQRHRSCTCVALSQSLSKIVSMENRCELCFRLFPDKKSMERCLNSHPRRIRPVSRTTATKTTTAMSTETATATLSTSGSSSTRP